MSPATGRFSRSRSVGPHGRPSTETVATRCGSRLMVWLREGESSTQPCLLRRLHDPGATSPASAVRAESTNSAVSRRMTPRRRPLGPSRWRRRLDRPRPRRRRLPSEHRSTRRSSRGGTRRHGASSHARAHPARWAVPEDPPIRRRRAVDSAFTHHRRCRGRSCCVVPVSSRAAPRLEAARQRRIVRRTSRVWAGSHPCQPAGTTRGRPPSRLPSSLRFACGSQWSSLYVPISAVASTPPITGIWRFINTRSNRLRSSTFKASNPFRARVT